MNLTTLCFTSGWRMPIFGFCLLFFSPLHAESGDHSGHDHAPKQSSMNAPMSDDVGANSNELLPLQAESSVTYKYVCPMHPQIVKDHEGSCPICGMDLIRKSFEASQGAPKIQIAGHASSGIKQAFAIRTTEVKKHTLWKYIETFGRVVPDDTQVVHIHPRASGWLSDLKVRSNGDAIQKGQLLYRLYSPEIVTAQQDFILAIRNKKRLGQAGQSLVESAKVRLSLLGLAKQTIRQVEKRLKPIYNIPIYAPQSGVAGNLVVQDGMYIQPQIELMSLSKLDKVWVEAEVMALQQDWVKKGLSVELSSDAFPDQYFESQIDYLYPTADLKTQALKVRIPLANDSGQLKPNHLMNVVIYGGPKRNVIAIPIEAILEDGKIKRVVKQLEDGQFQVAEVVTGMETNGITEIYAGLKEGDKIVTSGQFLIDSESQIQTNIRRLISGEDSQ